MKRFSSCDSFCDLERGGAIVQQSAAPGPGPGVARKRGESCEEPIRGRFDQDDNDGGGDVDDQVPEQRKREEVVVESRGGIVTTQRKGARMSLGCQAPALT